MSETIEIIFLIIAILLVLSVAASKISDRFGIPALIIFVAIGMLAGSEGLGGIYFDNPAIAQAVGLFALSVILFSGGLDTSWEDVQQVIKPSLSLATIGVALTASVLGIAAHYLLGITWLEGLLLGSITSSTDAAAVFSVIRSQGIRLRRKLSPLLEVESGCNDPMAVFLTIGFIQLLLTPGTSVVSLLGLFVQQMLIGGVVGYFSGTALLFLINRLRLGYEGLYPVLALGMLLLAFALTSLLHGSGFLAVYIVGLVLGKADFLHKRSLSRFYDGIAWLLQIIMFLTLGLLVFPSHLLAVTLPGLLLAVILILVARPLGVWVSLSPFNYSTREKAFISWVGLRGAVPIILATYPRLAGLEESGLIFNVVFFVVLSSVLVQGTSISKAAQWLRVEDPNTPERDFPVEVHDEPGLRGVQKELVVQENSKVCGKAIYEIKLPHDFLILLIARGDEFLIPNGSIILKPNDRILGLAPPETHIRVAELIQPPNL